MSGPQNFPPSHAAGTDTLLETLRQSPGIHAARQCAALLDGQPGTVFWLSGPGSAALAMNPPADAGPHAQLVAVSAVPAAEAGPQPSVWTPATLARAKAALQAHSGTADVELSLQNATGSRVPVADAGNAHQTAPDLTPYESVIGQSRGDIPALCAGPALVWPAAFPRDCVEALERAAASPAQTIIYRGAGQVERISYANLKQKALHILAGLQAAGLRPADTLLVASNDAEVFLCGLWAAILGGFHASAIELPDAQADHAAYHRLEAACSVLDNPPLVLGAQAAAQRAHVPALAARRLLHVETLAQTPATQAHIHTPDPEDTALIILTSGSSGVPKGVMQSHRAILSLAAGVLTQHCEGSPDDIVMNWLPRDHVGAMVFVFMGAVCLRASQVHADTGYILGQPERWLELVDRERISITWSPNFVYELLARAARDTRRTYDLSCLRYIFNGGESVNEQALQGSIRELSRHGLQAAAMKPAFGMSETCAPVTLGQLGHMIGAFTSLGPPVRGCRLRVVDDDDRLLTEGEIGRIQVDSPQLLTRYYGLPEGLARVQGSSWFDTGDSGFLADGALYITGRIKDTLNVRGVTLFAHELENTLARIPGIDPTCLAALPVRFAGHAAEDIAIVFATFPASGLHDQASLRALIHAIQDALRTTHAIATANLVPLDPAGFPRTPIGKIVKRELRERLENGDYRPELEHARQLGQPAALSVGLHRGTWMPVTPEALCARGLAPAHRLLSIGPGDRVQTIVDALEQFRPTPARPTLFIDLRPLLTATAARPGEAYHLLRALAHALNPTQEQGAPTLRCIVSHCLHAQPGDAPRPEAAMLHGLINSFNLDSAGWRWALADLEPEAPASAALALAGCNHEPVVALRGQRFLVPRLQPLRPDWQAPEPPRGLWVVIGGLGGLGEQCAQVLLAAGASVLLCATRTESALPADRQQRLATLAARGTVRYCAAPDAASLLAEVVAGERSTGLDLQGVVHAAGVDLNGDEAWTDEGFQRGLTASLGRLLDLQALSRHRPEMQAVIIASVTGEAGGRVHSYAAQQAALLSMAQSLATAQRPPTILAFSAWENTGLSNQRTNAGLLARDGLHMIAPRTGRKVLQWAFANPGQYLCVGLDDGHPGHAWRVLQPPRALLEPVARSASGGGALCLTDACGQDGWIPVLGPGAAHPQADPAAACIAGFFAQVLNRAALDIHDDFFMVGGDSVSATRLAAQLSEWFFSDIPVAAIFQHSSPNALARYLRGEIEPELFATVVTHLETALDHDTATP